MSLNVYLELPGAKENSNGSGIYIRESGQTREITRDEWDKKFPGCEPVVAREGDEGYSANITHNLGTMAGEAGIYKHLWWPEEVDITHAHQLIEPLKAGLELLESDRSRFEEFNPENGWGDYDVLVRFTREYLAACKRYPQAKISISR